MRIGDAARLLGMPVSTIRYYERIGIVGPFIRSAGVRHFGETDIVQLQFVQLAQGAGFGLEEIRQVIASSKNGAPCGEGVAALAAAKQREVRQKIDDLQRLDGFLGQLVRCQCVSLDMCVQQKCLSDSKA